MCGWVSEWVYICVVVWVYLYICRGHFGLLTCDPRLAFRTFADLLLVCVSLSVARNYSFRLCTLVVLSTLFTRRWVCITFLSLHSLLPSFPATNFLRRVYG